jgi:dTDP-4-dehydrorhamnose reductase
MKILLIGGAGFIGKRLAAELVSKKHEVLIGDVAASTELQNFAQVDILNYKALEEVIVDFNPALIINLASRTDAGGETLADYEVNTLGVANLVDVLTSNGNVQAVLIHFSTQFVIGPKFHDCLCGELHPYTLYGESKAIGESLLCELPSERLLIVRPSAVWGPSHPSFAQTVLPFIEKRLIFQSTRETRRSEINVNTLVTELSSSILPNLNEYFGKVVYLANEPADARKLFDSFSIELTGRRVRRLHPIIIRFLGISAEFLTKVGLELPINRLKMEILTENYLLPAEFQRLPKISVTDFDSNIHETIGWYKSSNQH